MSRGNDHGGYRGVVAMVVLACALALVPELGHPIQGAHNFRQTHVAANIERFVRDGLSWTPRTYNDDATLYAYDFPLYPWTAAVIVGATGLPVVPAARLLTILCWLVLIPVLDRILVHLGQGRGTRLIALLVAGASPIGLYYGAGVLPDPAGVTLSAASLLGYLSWKRHARTRSLVLGMACGWTAALIKPPVFLPVALTVAWDAVRSLGWRRALRPPLLVFGAGTVAAVLGHRLYADAVNAPLRGWPTLAMELEWYFGTLADRLDRGAWSDLLRSLRLLVVGSVPAVAVVVGWVLAFRRHPLLARWATMALVTATVFFNVHRIHAYYQLVFVAPFATLAGTGFASLHRPLQRLPAWGRTLVVLALAGATVWTNAGRATHMRRDLTAADRAAGLFVHAHTDPRDYVLYGVHPMTWNPKYLYYAGRHGRNVDAERPGTWDLEPPSRARRVVLFLPDDVDAAAPPASDLLAEGPHGRLYRR